MKGFHSPEEEGSWEITHVETNAKRPGDPEQKKKKEELWSELIEPEPTKGNATPAKGWRTVNPLSD